MKTPKPEDAMTDPTSAAALPVEAPLQAASEALLRVLAEAMAKVQGKRVRPKRGPLHRV